MSTRYQTVASGFVMLCSYVGKMLTSAASTLTVFSSCKLALQ